MFDFGFLIFLTKCELRCKGCELLFYPAIGANFLLAIIAYSISVYSNGGQGLGDFCRNHD